MQIRSRIATRKSRLGAKVRLRAPKRAPGGQALALGPEEGPQQFGAVSRPDALYDLAAVVEPIILQDRGQRSNRPELGVTSPEDNPANARMQDRTGTQVVVRSS